MAEIIVYVDKHFGGYHTHFFESQGNLHNKDISGTGTHCNTGSWGDKISSFRIISGTWAFYRDPDFHYKLGKDKEYSKANTTDGMVRDVEEIEIEKSISSIQLISE
jgi:hypothetical protein